MSNKYFNYHFLAFFFPALIEIYCLLKNHDRIKTSYLTGAGVLFLCFLVIFLLASVRFARRSMECDLESYHYTEEILNQIQFDRSETTLYLDGGAGGYYLGNPSYLKYFFPLPLQRMPEDSTLPSHVDTLAKVSDFDGRYISLDEEWFFLNDDYPSIKYKIENEYHLVASYYIFSPKDTLFKYKMEPKLCDLYERNRRVPVFQ